MPYYLYKYKNAFIHNSTDDSLTFVFIMFALGYYKNGISLLQCLSFVNASILGLTCQ